MAVHQLRPHRNRKKRTREMPRMRPRTGILPGEAGELLIITIQNRERGQAYRGLSPFILSNESNFKIFCLNLHHGTCKAVIAIGTKYDYLAADIHYHQPHIAMHYYQKDFYTLQIAVSRNTRRT